MKPQKLALNWPLNVVILGGLVWLVTGMLRSLNVIEVGLAEHLFLLAPLVIVPLGLVLIEIPSYAMIQQWLYRLLKIGQPFCALLVVMSFLTPNGILAGILAASWLALTGLAALLGLIRFVSRRRLDVAKLCFDAGLIYLSVGGGWLVLSRLGASPLGFSDLIVLLTAVHFHFAGFAAPIITGMVGRFLTTTSQTQKWLYRLSAAGVVAGMPLVAAGITLSPLLEVMSAVFMATSLAILAYLIGFVVLRLIQHRLAQILLTVSAICLLLGMFLTYAYAVGEFSGYYWVTIPQMIRSHGVVNALGFALSGLLAWNILTLNA